MTIATPDRRHCLTEELWARIESCFPRPRGRKGKKGFQQKISNRDVFEAVLYRTRTGCPWRDLPTDYGYWHAIYMRWSRWVRAEVPQKAMIKLQAEQLASGEISSVLVLLDSTVVRAHQHAAGAIKKRARRLSDVRAAD